MLFLTYMDELKIVVVGCTKNSAGYIKNHLGKLMELDALCKELQIIVYENDSKDATLAVLRELEGEKLKVISERGVQQAVQKANPGITQHWLLRTCILARARNILVHEVTEHYSDYDYMIVSDLDEVVSRFTPKIIEKAFSAYDRSRWDALMANNIPFYYDAWALRIPQAMFGVAHSKIWDRHIDYDCWDMVKHYIEGRFGALPPARQKEIALQSPEASTAVNGWRTQYNIWRKEANDIYSTPYQKIIPVTSDLIEVESAFGGMGIYRVDKISGCTYRGTAGPCSCYKHGARGPCRPDTCEHVSFHRDMRRKHGARLFICPKLLVVCQEGHLQ